MRRHHIQPWNWPAESEQMMLISCYLLQFYSSISTNTLFQGCLVSSNLFYLLLLDCWFMFSFIRIHDLSKCWLFLDQASSDHHRSSIVIDWIKLYNEATSFSNIAAFSVLFEAPPKFMVIIWMDWHCFLSFCQFLICLIFVDLSGWSDNPIDSDDYLMIVRKIIIHHHCAQAWPTSQAWWSRRI